MKKGTKLGIGIGALLLGTVLLSGCTNSFCSTLDKAHILYGIDRGVCEYYNSEPEAQAAAEKLEGSVVGQVPDMNVYYVASFSKLNDEGKVINTNLNKIKTAAEKANINAPSIKYYIALDTVVLNHAIEAAKDFNKTTITAEQIGSAKKMEGVLYEYGYLKFYGTNAKESKKLWENLDVYDNEVRLNYVGTIVDSIDECPSSDYFAYYKQQMKNTINSYRSCLALRGGNYGKYGAEEIEVEIQEKSYGYAWKNGPLSGLLVWPIGALLDVFTVGMQKVVGSSTGWAQLLAILFVTLIVRSLMLLATFKQTTSSTKMQELQPEIAKIQAKYPNSNTNQYEKQRLAMETQALYKKHKINPLTSILVMIIQFPVFICVWGAMQGSAQLSSGAVLGLNLSTSISSVLTTWSNWSNPASGVWTALVLFLLMSAAQTVAMLLPQWLNAAKKKKIAKLGRNPAQKESDNKMKWFTYIMLAMIIFMGFSLVSALGVYWLVGALFSIAQTLITHAIMNRKKSKK